MPAPTPGGTIALAEEHLALRDSVRAFVAATVTDAVVRTAVDAKSEELPAFWSDLADQGLLGLHLPEDHGGSGAGVLELGIVLEQLGRVMAPGPFLPTVLASAVLDAAGHTDHLSGLADGSIRGAVALGGGVTATQDRGGVALEGYPGPVLGGVLADVLVLPVTLGGERRWVVVRVEQDQVTELPSHDLTRRFAEISLAGLKIPASDVLDIDAQRPLDLAATLFAAEATGLADWSTCTAADYAKVRTQFGRVIGQFQGVKHRVARMLARTEQARACAWDAARALDAGDRGEATLAAAVAAATTAEAAFGTAKDCINTLGGIGFTWEHDAGLFLRRAQTLRIVLGATDHWHRRVGELAAAGVRRTLAADLPPEVGQIRAEVRAELAPATQLGHAARLAYLAEHGYTSPHLPAPWGKAADAVTQLVIAEELQAAGLEPHDMIIGNWVVPTLVEHGSREQQQRYVPPSLRGDLVWCQLFSEPGAGSDLAGLSTRAEKVDGGWRVNGQKVWTSGARQADYGILLARTDPEAPRHKGLSYFVVDMRTPGIDIRPLRELTGEELFNEVFLDDVLLPDDALVAAPGDGWRLARTTLANERVSMTHGSSLGDGGEGLVALVGAAPDALRLATLGRIVCDAQSCGVLDLRTTLRSLAGEQPGAESSISKLLGGEQIQQLWETMMDWQGTVALTTDPEVRDATWWFLNSRCLSIAGGTTDVQLNIIGERILGLPRDPAPTA